MKNYMKPDADIVELELNDTVMGSVGTGGSFGVDDGEGWED